MAADRGSGAVGAGSPGPPPDRVAVARVGRPHGVRGEVRLIPESGDASRLLELPRLWLVQGGEERLVGVVAMRKHGDVALARFEGVEDRDAAAALVHAEAWAATDELPPFGGDEFGVAEVVGQEIWDGERRVGVVTGVWSGAGRDFFEVLHEGRQVLVPAVKDWLVERNEGEGRIVMRLPEGLLDE